ncbi:MAG: V-type ATP synthase subunit K [Candidatus Bipolaricaulia bacterium]
MTHKRVRQISLVLFLIGVALIGGTAIGLAQEEGEAATGSSIGEGLASLGAGLAFLGGAIGTGLAQSRAVAAVVGSVAEDPGQLGTGILLIVIPETLVILGFVALFLI